MAAGKAGVQPEKGKGQPSGIGVEKPAGTDFRPGAACVGDSCDKRLWHYGTCNVYYDGSAGQSAICLWCWPLYLAR